MAHDVNIQNEASGVARSGSSPTLLLMALQVLDTLSRFKASSRILGAAPHLLFLAAGELRLEPHPGSRVLVELQLNQRTHLFRGELSSIADLRRFALGFMDNLIQYYFFMHLERMRAMIVEMWRRMDAGLTEENGASWVDVMHEGEWEVFLG